MTIYSFQANTIANDIISSNIIYYNCTDNNSLKTYKYENGFWLCAEWKQ